MVKIDRFLTKLARWLAGSALRPFFEDHGDARIIPLGPRTDAAGRKEFVWLVPDIDRFASSEDLDRLLEQRTPAGHKPIASLPN
jgi:hypothetical protein